MNETYFYNQLIKYYVDNDGEMRPYQRMTFTKSIFNPYKHERRNYKICAKKYEIENMIENRSKNIDISYFVYLVQINKTIYTANTFENQIYDDVYNVKKLHENNVEDNRQKQVNKRDNVARAVRRAKEQIYDSIMANEFDFFITLTLDKNEISRTDVKEVVKKMNIFLQNRVQRKGLKYVIVPEYHKDGSIHFHGLINDCLNMIDSGTVKVPTYKKPIKIETADMYNIPLEDRKTVYNIPEWKYGFTTAIKLNDNKIAVAKYITKYITKDTKKITGRYYYHSSNLNKVIKEYKEVNYNSVQDKEIKTEYVDYKIWDL